MAIDFPNSPTVGQIYTSGDKSWIWDGTVWKAYGASLSPTVLKVDSTNSRVGINNQSPAYALDVAGDINASNALRIAGNTIGTWTSITPTWTASTTNPSIGNGFIELRYTRVGKFIVGAGYIIAGSTTTFGSGNYRLSVPITMKSLNTLIGSATLFDASAGYVSYFGAITQQSTTTLEFRLGNATGLFSPTVPITLANADQLRFNIVYEID